jgi:hypothetical protein
MDEGGKRVLGIMAAILAARNFIAFPQICGTTIDPVRRPSANDFWGVLLLPSTKLGDMTVRIVTWNCGMALAPKVPSLLALNQTLRWFRSAPRSHWTFCKATVFPASGLVPI